jgi:hypothetical protein
LLASIKLAAYVFNGKRELVVESLVSTFFSELRFLMPLSISSILVMYD